MQTHTVEPRVLRGPSEAKLNLEVSVHVEFRETTSLRIRNSFRLVSSWKY